MNQFINSMATNNTKTNNGMATNANSGSEIIDLFFLIGATRSMSEADIISVFSKAFDVDKTSALRILFYARDIDKGLGERRVFRVITKWLAQRLLISENILKEANITNNLIRVDDIVYLANEMVKMNKVSGLFKPEIDNCIRFLFGMLKNKTHGGIVAKWMPRKNSQYGTLVQYMRTHRFIETYSDYRRLISSMTKVVEQQMSKNDWEQINLEHVPSVAMHKYKKAFKNHNILEPFVAKLIAGEAKVHAKRLFPYDIVRDIILGQYSCKLDTGLLDAQWKALKDLEDLPKEFRAIPVIDVSGSMEDPNLVPMSMAVGLGLFLAERNPNPVFRDSFITFSDHPAFQQILGHDIVEKVKNALRAQWSMNTNLEATFELILKKSVENRVSPNEMPTHLIIISDMEFDQCATNDSESAMQMIRRQYQEAGYEMPTIVFWNVSGRAGNVPARKNDKNVILISGASQNVINFVLKKQYDDLMGIVLEVINNPRYEHILI